VRRALIAIFLSAWAVAVSAGIAAFSAYMRGTAWAYATGWGSERGERNLVPDDHGQAFSNEVGGTFLRVFSIGIAGFGSALAIIAACAWLTRNELPKRRKPLPIWLIQLCFLLELTRLASGVALYNAFPEVAPSQAANGWFFWSALAVAVGWSATVTSASWSTTTLLGSLMVIGVNQMLPSLRFDGSSLVWFGLFVLTWKARSVRDYLQPLAPSAA